MSLIFRLMRLRHRKAGLWHCLNRSETWIGRALILVLVGWCATMVSLLGESLGLTLMVSALWLAGMAACFLVAEYWLWQFDLTYEHGTK